MIAEIKIDAMRRNVGVRDRLPQTIKRIVPRRLAQTGAVAASVRPAFAFVLGVVRDDPGSVFFSRRLGHPVWLRARGDLQVARELLSKDAYAVPPEVSDALAGVRPLTVLDLGANIGLFALSVIHALGPGTRIRAVEPDPANLALLRKNIELLGQQHTIEVYPCAAATRSGTAQLVGGLTHSSHLVRPGECSDNSEQVPLMDAYELAAGCGLLKIDIEGSEWQLLSDPRLKDCDARAIALEWHTAGTRSDTPEEDVVKLLRAARFTVGYVESHGVNGFLWAWRA